MRVVRLPPGRHECCKNAVFARTVQTNIVVDRRAVSPAAAAPRRVVPESEVQSKVLSAAAAAAGGGLLAVTSDGAAVCCGSKRCFGAGTRLVLIEQPVRARVPIGG